MALYRITIEKATTNDDGSIKSWGIEVGILASTQYLLEDDVPEWIREEIDPGAEIDRVTDEDSDYPEYVEEIEEGEDDDESE
jgi:hypothetical protein